MMEVIKIVLGYLTFVIGVGSAIVLAGIILIYLFGGEE